MTNVQEWLDQNYPKEKRKEFIFLDISDKNLEGELILNDFINLEELNCSENKLTKLDITSCSKLKKLDCIMRIKLKMK